jgi:hypothetical protein
MRTGPRMVATRAGAVTASPSRACQSTSHPSSSKTASTKGTPASVVSVLHSSAASAGASPTTAPPMSKEGTSSFNQLRTLSLKLGGSSPAVLDIVVQRTLSARSLANLKSFCMCALQRIRGVASV